MKLDRLAVRYRVYAVGTQGKRIPSGGNFLITGNVKRYLTLFLLHLKPA